MSKFIRTLSLLIIIWLLAGCTREIPGSVPIANQGSDAGADPTIKTLGSETTDLQLQARNDDIQYVDIPGTNERGFIRYIYVFSNVGTTIFDGPVEVIDDKAQVDCKPINTVGNLDDKLDPGEGSLCEGGYMFTQADLDAGKVVSRSRVSVEGGAVISAEVVTDVSLQQTRALTLTTAADKQTYDQAGQEITITYVILNDGNVTLGPAQFTVSDSLLGAPLNCGAAGTSLPPNGLLNCSATYAITQADLDSGSVISDATASDGTTISSVAKLLVSKAIGTQPPVSGLTPGTTVQHTVVPGDWLMQIARCYGADYDTVRRANPHIYTPGLIWSGQVVSVPNIGSTGTIYGPPCVVFHTAVLGDTWESLAAAYNARLDILKRVNPGGLFTGANIKVPINSAGGSSSSVPTTKRISFAPGAVSATETGALTPFGEITYLVAASKGQKMTVTLTAPAGEVAMGIYAPDGGTLLNPSGLATSWNGTLPADGDYRIKLVSVLGIMDKNCSLKVEITSSVGTLERVPDIPGNASDMTVYNGLLYFATDGGDGAGKELWKYDGTNANRVADIWPGPESSNPSFLTVYDGKLYFSADVGDTFDIRRLGVYDDTTKNATVVTTETISHSDLVVYNGLLYYKAVVPFTGVGYELYKYDGTTGSLAVDIASGDANSNPRYPAVYNGVLYFLADGRDGAGEELWKYDGTSANLAVDILPGPVPSLPEFLTVFDDALYFAAFSEPESVTGPLDTNPDFLASYRETHNTYADEIAGRELWKYDGTNASLAADIWPGNRDSRPSYLVVYNGALYFQADGGDGAGRELWKYDGTSSSRVADIWSGPGESIPTNLAVYNGALYFSASDGDLAVRNLWRYISP